MLRGCDTPGYVIVSAAKAQILQRLHAPVWKDNNLVPKTTWRGTLDCMQYYATVENTTTAANSDDDVQWLTTEHIEVRLRISGVFKLITQTLKLYIYIYLGTSNVQLGVSFLSIMD